MRWPSGSGPAAAAIRPRETHLVLIPSYNSGSKLSETVADLSRYNLPVLVVIDGSTDGSGAALEQHGRPPGLTVIHRIRNGGKGAAVLDGLRAAQAAGFTHALVMDADGQHPASLAPEFLSLSRRHPAAMILGLPVFDHSAPLLRVLGRRLSNAITKLETFGAIGDSLFGFRVYPVAPLLAVMEATHRMRGYDFDPEGAVRLWWRGIDAINRPAPVRYLRPEEGGVSHFRYGRDNVVLAAMHVRLLAALVRRLPRVAERWIRSCRR